MDYVLEAKKFVQRANEADHPEVIKEHLKMADWCLKQAIDERDDKPSEVPRKANGSAGPPGLTGVPGQGQRVLVATTSR